MELFGYEEQKWKERRKEQKDRQTGREENSIIRESNCSKCCLEEIPMISNSARPNGGHCQLTMVCVCVCVCVCMYTS